MSEDRLVQLLIEIRETLKRNERYLEQIGKFHSEYQYRTYQQLYGMIEEARKEAVARASESAGGDDERS